MKKIYERQLKNIMSSFKVVNGSDEKQPTNHKNHTSNQKKLQNPILHTTSLTQN